MNTIAYVDTRSVDYRGKWLHVVFEMSELSLTSDRLSFSVSGFIVLTTNRNIQIKNGWTLLLILQV